ncbi:glycoside hydrolase family 2 protein [Amnibacterium flavum]|uniref:beta-mannosidase n=1 Tax=Amnibacterium flavum TaxID=2173173 RepID=A0A2V1HLD8_9MICO|nr:glycoside hydrolase family 2 protein [Amnibacterium flavum]PVZ93255.1 beta-mannosidase [Amnibacterium flavum]
MIVDRTVISDWTVEGSGTAVPPDVRSAGPIAASVPGSVHTDLMRAELIPDPYLDENEKTQSWIGLTDWTYRTTVTWAPDGSERQELVFEGIDTIARISLGGDDIAVTRNMHRTHRIDVTGRLASGDNQLQVAISSPIKAADAASMALGYRPHANHHPYNSIRKMASSFGWDWGIDTCTSALWKPVALETWSQARLAELRIGGDVVDGVPRLRVTGTIDVTGFDEPLELAVSVAGHVLTAPVRAGVAEIYEDVPNAALWWPRGYGEPALHHVVVTLRSGDEVVDDRNYRVGFRSVEARTQPDATGVGFKIVVNGQTIHVRGANWIADDAFLHRVDRARYSRRLAQAEFANVNLIRVWGGGIYESEDFYAECDERGLLVWQDFLLACAAYAEDEPLWSEFGAEAHEAIVRLSAHPSLVLLNGNNENIWGFQEWDWEKRLDGRTWGAAYYYELFPSLVAELAPHVAYTPGSPFTPDRSARQNDPSQGTAHIWDIWNEKDWPHYRDYRPRFVSEFGWQGPPAWSTLMQSVSDSPLTPESPGMLVHQKAIKGNDKLTDGLTAHFPLPNEMGLWHWAMSLNQAIAVRAAIEWYRSLTPHCTGTIVWQLNDCWPVTSWAAIDGYERPKPLLYALRHAYSDRLLTIQPDESGALRVAIINDSQEKWIAELTIERRDYAGLLIDQQVQTLRVAPDTAMDVAINKALATPGRPSNELVIARLGDATALWFFSDYRDSELTSNPCTAIARFREGGWDVIVRAHSLARDVALLVDRVHPDAVASDALFTLLPGESTTIRVVGALDADGADFSAPTVLRTANDLLSKRDGT